MNNEILKEAIKEMISQEDIRKEVRAILLDKWHSEMMRIVREEIEEMCKDHTSDILQNACDEIMNSHVLLDDGWGNTSDEGSFEDYVRAYIKKNTLNQWHVESKVREAVDNRLKEICKSVASESVEDRTEEVLARLRGKWDED